MDNKTWHNCTTNSEGRSCLFKGLLKKTKYHVRVQAFNTKGASDWSYGFISAGLSGMLQTHIQSLICIRAVINGEDLVNEGRRKPEATSLFLLARVSLPLHMHISFRE